MKECRKYCRIINVKEGIKQKAESDPKILSLPIKCATDRRRKNGERSWMG